MNNQSQTSILEVNRKDIIETTKENIQTVILNTINNNSVLVTSSNNIKFEHVKISNSKGKIEVNQKNANCLIIDEEFNNEMNTNISETYISSFYNEIVENVNIETLKEINDNLNNSIDSSYISNKEYAVLNINDYINIQNKSYNNIFNKIHTIISNSKITENINSCISKVQQYNYISVKDIQFGSSKYLDEQSFKDRKTKIDVLFNQENTSDMLLKCITSTEEITDILDNIIDELSKYEQTFIHRDINKKDKEYDKKNKKDKELDKKDKKIDSKTAETTNKTKIFKIVLIIVVCIIILLILVIVFILFYKHKHIKEDKFLKNKD